MANKNVSQVNARHEITSAVDDAAQLSIIMEWVESARRILSVVEWVADSTPEFKALCKKHEIPIGNAPWDTEQSDALSRLFTIQRKYLNHAGDAAEVSHV